MDASHQLDSSAHKWKFFSLFEPCNQLKWAPLFVNKKSWSPIWWVKFDAVSSCSEGASNAFGDTAKCPASRVNGCQHGERPLSSAPCGHKNYGSPSRATEVCTPKNASNKLAAILSHTTSRICLITLRTSHGDTFLGSLHCLGSKG